ncbi:hypothetical protein BH09BAC4_BH09BAC4_23500 [soil metagenome]
MKWAFSMKQKLKAAGFLLGILLVTLLTSISMKQATQDMDRMLAEINTDRLQPAVDLVYISESLHAKRLLLEAQLLNKSVTMTSTLPSELNQYDATIRDKLAQFEKTKLTDSEANWLSTFKKQWAQSVDLERAVLRLIELGQPEAALQVFSTQGLPLFKQGVQSVHKLAHIQSETGHNAAKEAHRVAASVSLNATVLLAITVIIGLLTLNLIQKVKLPDQRAPPFHLN